MTSARPISDHKLWNALYGSLEGSWGDPQSVANIFQQTAAGSSEGIVGATGFVPTNFTTSTLSIVSADAADAGAGTGLQRLLVAGVDANGNEISEVVTMNGVTPVITGQSFKHVNSGHALSVGSGGSAAGLITITKGASVVGGIPIGLNYISTSAYMVPTGKAAFASSLYVMPISTSASEFVVQRIRGEDLATRRNILQVTGPSTSLVSYVRHPIPASLALLDPGDLTWVECNLTGSIRGTFVIGVRDA